MPQSSYSLAVRKLSIRAYSTKEMQQLLKRAGYDSPDIIRTIEKLQALGYLDDARLADALYTCYTGRKPCGPALLKIKLLQKGLSEDLIESTLTGYNDEMELQLAIRLTQKYLRRSQHEADALARFLLRKGFRRNIITNILDSFTLSGDI